MEDSPIDAETASYQSLQNGETYELESQNNDDKIDDRLISEEIFREEEVSEVTLAESVEETIKSFDGDQEKNNSDKYTNGEDSEIISDATHQGNDVSTISQNSSLLQIGEQEIEEHETIVNEIIIEEDSSSDEVATASEPDSKKKKSSSNANYKSELVNDRACSSLEKSATGIRKRKRKRKKIICGMPSKKSLFPMKFSDIFQAYEKSLKIGNPDKIEEAFHRLSFKGLKTSSHKISALQLVDLKGGRQDAEFRQALMSFIKYPKIAEEGVFDHLLKQLRSTSDIVTKRIILKEMSSNAMVDFIEVLRLHGIWHLKNKCLTCDKTFIDKSSCMQHTFNDHEREENLERFRSLLEESKAKINNEIHYREMETSSNTSSEASLIDVGHRSSKNMTKRAIIRIERASTNPRNNNRVSGFIKVATNLRGAKTIANSSNSKLVAYSKNFSNYLMQPPYETFQSQASLIKSEIQLEDCAVLEHSNASTNNSTPIITSSRGNKIFRKSPMLEVTSTGFSNSTTIIDDDQILQVDLGIIVTHEDYPDVKLSEEQFTLFKRAMIREIRASQQWPKLEDSKYRSTDGVFVVVAADRNSKNWFCEKIMCSALGNVPLRIQKMFTAMATVPLFDECKDSNQILQELNNYNPLLMTDKWEVIEEQHDDNDCCLVIQMMEPSVEALAILDYRPYYHFGRVNFQVYG